MGLQLLSSSLCFKRLSNLFFFTLYLVIDPTIDPMHHQSIQIPHISEMFSVQSHLNPSLIWPMVAWHFKHHGRLYFVN